MKSKTILISYTVALKFIENSLTFLQIALIAQCDIKIIRGLSFKRHVSLLKS